MKRKDPTPIDDTWYFRGQMMKNVMELYEGSIGGIRFKTVLDANLKKVLNLAFLGCQLLMLIILVNGRLWAAL